MIAFVYDTETSGLINNRSLPLNKQPEIIEFYGCVVDLRTGEILSEIETLIKPKVAVSDLITRITGIDNDLLQGAPDFTTVAPLIKATLEAQAVVIAHNASFDVEMVDIEFERLNQTIEWSTQVICTVEATLPLKGFRFKLQGLHEHLFGVPFAEAHRAKNDVVALTRCCVELFMRGDL